MANQILIIENNIEMLENMTAILHLAHYTVATAANGKDGIDMALKINPDLILCDITMPGLDGYGVLHILRTHQETERIPVIFVTGQAEKSDFRMGMNMGADDYLTKPFDGIDLLRAVEIRIQRSELFKSHIPHGNHVSSQWNLVDLQQVNVKKLYRTFKRKDMLFMEGQNPNELYYIETGHVKTYKVNFDGKELITGLHASGDYLGYLPLLRDKPYNENAEAMDTVKVSVIQKPEFVEMVYHNKSVASKFIHALTRDVEEMEDRLMDVAYRSVRQRVARELLRLEENLPSTQETKLITVARRDISSIVGTATESLNRTLADFKDERLIEVSEHGLRIINKDKLELVVRM